MADETKTDAELELPLAPVAKPKSETRSKAVAIIPKEVETAKSVTSPKRVKPDTFLNVGDFCAVQDGAVVAASAFIGTRKEFAAAWYGVSNSVNIPGKNKDRFPGPVSAKRGGAWECHIEGELEEDGFPAEGTPVGPLLMPDGKLHPMHLETCPAEEAIGTVNADGNVVFK